MKKTFLFAILCCFIFSSTSCSKNFEEYDVSSNLKKLEDKYNVKINDSKKTILNQMDISKIEKEILASKNKLAELNCKNIPLQIKTESVLTKGMETVNLTTWAFNLTWLHVAGSILDDTTFSATSWITGVSFYSYVQQSLNHVFTPNSNQRIVRFQIIGAFTLEITEVIGVTYTYNGLLGCMIDYDNYTGEINYTEM
jgi:hypothetical protein